MKKIVLPLFILMMAFLILPGSADAFTGTSSFISITPDATDISDVGEDDTPEGVDFYQFSASDTEATYTAVFSVSEEPAGMTVTGADMESYTYDATAGTLTIEVDYLGYSTTQDFGPYEPFGIAIIWVAADGEDGPPEEMKGFWMSTNLTNWELVPPNDSQDSPGFGYVLSGDEGTSGQFKMFMTDGTREMLSEMAGEELDWDDLALFMDDDQATMNITEMDGGALVHIQVNFTENTTQLNPLSSRTDEEDDSVTKELTMKERGLRSFACKSYRKGKGDKYTCYGYIKNASVGDKVSIMRKPLGISTYKVVDKVVIRNANGYFKTRLTQKAKTGTLKAKWVNNKNKVRYTNTRKVRITK